MSGATPRVAGFDDLKVIGRGGFSTVYSAVQADLGRRVAIKVLNFDVAEGAAQRRFERECRVVGILSGVPGVVAVHQSAFTDDGRPCIVMQLMEGGTLQSHVRAEGPLGFGDARELTELLGEALAAAHAKDVAHRDIKPGNVLLSASRTPALADFGIAVVNDLASSSQTIESLSPPFAPPERLLGDEIDEKLADIYSLGATIAFSLTGAAPFGTAERGGVSGLVHRVLEDPPPELRGRGLPTAFADLVAQMLDKRPDRRPVSASEVVRRVLDISETKSTQVAQPPRQRPAARMPKQHGAPGQAKSDDSGVVIPPAPGSPAVVGFSLDPSGAGGDQVSQPYNPLRDPGSYLGQDLEEDEDLDSGVWPTAVDYVQAIQDSSTLLDGDLASATVRQDMLGMPVSAAGQSAVVFHIDNGREPAAVRFFTRPPRDGRVRYRALAEHMLANPCEPVVSARWVESAIQIDDYERPAVWMPWAEGRPLNLAVEDLLGDPVRIESLAMIWLDVLDAMRESRIAHGDLQNGNILVTDDLSVSLVDLDGIWVPSLAGRPPAETGHLCFQHRARAAEHWGAEMDTFSGLLIFTSLLALAAEPQLWQFHQGENLILAASDLRGPESTEAWQAMAASRSPLVQALTAMLVEQAGAPAPPEGSVRDYVEAHGGTEESTLRRRTAATAEAAKPSAPKRVAEVSQAGSDWWMQPATSSGDPAEPALPSAVSNGSETQVQSGSVWASGSSIGANAAVTPSSGTRARSGLRGFLARNHVASGLVMGLLAGVVATLVEAGAFNLLDARPETSLLVLCIAAMAAFGGLLRSWPELMADGIRRSSILVLVGSVVAAGVTFAFAIILDQAVSVDNGTTSIGTGDMLWWVVPAVAIALGLVGFTRSVSAGFTYAAAGLVGGALMVMPISARGIDVLNDSSMAIDMAGIGGPVAVSSAMMLLGFAVGVGQWLADRASSTMVSP